MKKLVILLLIALSVSGCAHVISEETRKTVDSGISFAQVKEKPDLFIGKTVLVGGKIVAVANSKEGGQLEVIQFPLDRTGYPVEMSKSDGRFLCSSPDMLDPEVYQKGRLITVAGEVKGHRKGQVDGAEYTFPVIGMKEIFNWKIKEADEDFDRPTPNFYNNYNPYDFGHDVPLWYRPIGPVIRP